MTGFKHRAGISRAKFIPRKRNIDEPAETFEPDLSAAVRYIDKVEQAVQSIPIERIINVDETPSYVRNAPSHALHFIDSPLPWAWTRTQERDKVTVIAACTGDGSMLKAAIVAKGSTSRCEAAYLREIGDLAYVQHTPSLTNTYSFIDNIDSVILRYTNGRPSALIVDSWGAHLTQPVRDFCASRNIKLIRVPSRATSILQPLDVGVFGVAKCVIYADAKESFFELIRPEEDRWHATAACVEALRNVSCRAVQPWTKVVVAPHLILDKGASCIQAEALLSSSHQHQPVSRVPRFDRFGIARSSREKMLAKRAYFSLFDRQLIRNSMSRSTGQRAVNFSS